MSDASVIGQLSLGENCTYDENWRYVKHRSRRWEEDLDYTLMGFIIGVVVISGLLPEINDRP